MIPLFNNLYFLFQNYNKEQLMIDNKQQFEEWSELDYDSIDFEDLESKLDAELEEQMSDLEGLENEQEQIGNPDTLGETVLNVVWEQFINQVGVIAGEDFIRENRGLTLDLRNSSHIQTGENFKKTLELDGKIDALDKKIDSGNATTDDKVQKNILQIKRSGKIATHNESIDFNKRYESYKSNFVYDENGNIVTKHDRIDKEDKPVLKEGYRKPFDDERNKDPKKVGSASVHVDECVSVGEQCRDADLNAYVEKEDIIKFDLSDENLHPMSAPANISKNDHDAINWLESERDGEKPAERFDIDEEQIRDKYKKAKEKENKIKEEGKQKAIETGKESRKQEALRISGKALRSVLMGLLASLIKDIIRKLIAWFRSGERKLKTFINSVKEALSSFISNIKEHLLNAGNTLVTTIATAIFGPIIGTLKKAWIYLKQGYKSIKEAVHFMKNPANKDMPFGIKLMEIGKIITVGLTAGGAIVLSEVIEKGLMTIPGFAFEIPLLGSLANLIGMFLGALVSGLIGALALNLIDKAIARKMKNLNLQQQIQKRNDIIQIQGGLIEVTKNRVQQTKEMSSNHIKERHAEAVEEMKNDIQQIINNSVEIDMPLLEEAEVVEEDVEPVSENKEDLDNLLKDIESI